MSDCALNTGSMDLSFLLNVLRAFLCLVIVTDRSKKIQQERDDRGKSGEHARSQKMALAERDDAGADMPVRAVPTARENPKRRACHQGRVRHGGKSKEQTIYCSVRKRKALDTN
jgi:hypothetical protein